VPIAAGSMNALTPLDLGPRAELLVDKHAAYIKGFARIWEVRPHVAAQAACCCRSGTLDALTCQGTGRGCPGNTAHTVSHAPPPA
jgi:hypothetical protein